MEKEGKSEVKKKISNLYREAIRAVEQLKDLDLSKETKKSRVTFSNPRRVVALELRKHYVLVHCPEEKFIASLLVEEDGKKKIQGFILTKDSRGFTYIRLYTLLEISNFQEAVKVFAQHNR